MKDIVRKLTAPMVCLILLICGCGGPTQLEQTVSKLKPGMNKGEIKQLFADFELVTETNRIVTVSGATGYDGTGATRFYGTNYVSASWIIYCPKGIFHAMEDCIIYFDTNDTIIAIYYIPPGHRGPKLLTNQ